MVIVSACTTSNGTCTGQRVIETCGPCKTCNGGSCVTDDSVGGCPMNETCMNGSCGRTCGANGQACCTTGAECADGLGCDFFNKVCGPCGNNTQACCNNKVCNLGFVCDGTCTPCGKEGHLCCANKLCDSARNVCLEANGGLKCLHCGAAMETCCGVPGSAGTCDAGLRCNAIDGEMFFGSCVTP
jgi:hypothetical protein